MAQNCAFLVAHDKTNNILKFHKWVSMHFENMLTLCYSFFGGKIWFLYNFEVGSGVGNLPIFGRKALFFLIINLLWVLAKFSNALEFFLEFLVCRWSYHMLPENGVIRKRCPVFLGKFWTPIYPGVSLSARPPSPSVRCTLLIL